MTDFGPHDAALTRALRAMAEDDEPLAASAAVEARLLTEARAIVSARRRHAYMLAAALAATLVAALVVPLWRTTVRQPAVNQRGPAESSGRSAPGEDATEFFPLMFSNVPVTDGETVRLELPQTALTSFGLEADDASGTVLADVVVGQDGLARALRFVWPATNRKESR